MHPPKIAIMKSTVQAQKQRIFQPIQNNEHTEQLCGPTFTEGEDLVCMSQPLFESHILKFTYPISSARYPVNFYCTCYTVSEGGLLSLEN